MFNPAATSIPLFGLIKPGFGVRVRLVTTGVREGTAIGVAPMLFKFSLMQKRRRSNTPPFVVLMALTNRSVAVMEAPLHAL